MERAEKYDTQATLLALERAMNQAVELAGKLYEVHDSLAVDQNYLARVAQFSRGGGGGGGGGAGAGGVAAGWEDDAMLSK